MAGYGHAYLSVTQPNFPNFRCLQPLIKLIMQITRFARFVSRLVSALFLSFLAFSNAQAADNKLLLQLATCEESWMDWGKSSPKFDDFRKMFSTDFKQKGGGANFAPIKPLSILGYSLTEVYPESVGMGVGFSVLVDAEFDKVKASLEAQVGKTIGECSKEGDSRSCEHTIGEKKTLLLMEGGRGKNAKTLFGCYYFYAK